MRNSYSHKLSKTCYNTAMEYKEFINQIEHHLKNMTAADMKHVIRAMAEDVKGAQRHSFLSQLESIYSEKKKGRQASQTTTDKLRKQIVTFAAAIDDGHFCDGWGWDPDLHDKRDWGDESWAGQMDDYLQKLRRLVLEGEYSLTRELYQVLLDSFDQGHEPGHLPGHPDPSYMMDEDVEEHLAFFLVTVYLTTPPDERPTVLSNCLNRFNYIGYGFEIGELTKCLSHPLPDFDSFLVAWLELLLTQDAKGNLSSIREALKLQGIDAQAIFASRHYSDLPDTYIDWVDHLTSLHRSDEAIQVAQKGLKLSDLSTSAKAKLADRLASLANSRKRSTLQLEALWKAFDYSPSLDRLIRWFERTDQVKDDQSKATAWQAAIDRLQDHSSNTLRGHALLISGRLIEALDLCIDQSRTVKSFGIGALDDLVLGYLLKALAQGGPYRTQIERIWQQLVVESSGRPLIEVVKSDESKRIYAKLATPAFSKQTLSPQQMNQMMEWVTSQVNLRIAPILAEKHRSRYPFAAQLVIVMIEVMVNQNKIRQASEYLGSIKNHYNRLSAFQRELRSAIRIDPEFEKVLSPVSGDCV